MNNVVTQRFVKCIKQLKEDGVIRSMRQFATSLEYLPQSLSEILKGRRDVTIELLRKAVAFYKFNPVYIYTGEGPLFMSEEDHKSFRVLTIVTNSTNDERIVHVPVPAQAGYASELTNPVFIQDLPSFSLPDYKYKVGTHRSFDVAGDSMEPTLFEGDKVVCSFLEPTLWETSIKNNYVYVITTRADILVKRVFNKIKEEKRLELHSDNNFYEPESISLNDIREMWYVRAKISPFLPSPKNISNLLVDEMQNMRTAMREQAQMIENLNKMLQELMDR